jgi:hypothetical protein
MSTEGHGHQKGTVTDGGTGSPYVRRELTGSWKPYMRTGVNKDGYVTWRQSSQNQRRVNFPVHRLLAVAEYGFEAVLGKEVHHENGVPWDNRPDNISLVDPAEHRQIHNGPRISDQDLLMDLRAGAAVLGRAPKTTDVENFGQYSWTAYRRRFGTLCEALEAAGIDPKTGELDEGFYDD